MKLVKQITKYLGNYAKYGRSFRRGGEVIQWIILKPKRM